MERKYVSNKDESVRMFKSGALEIFTKVHFSVPLFIYLPVIGYCLYLSTFQKDLSLTGGIIAFLVGFVSWTIVEYVMHRFVFHYQPNSKVGRRLHFIFHGVHHDYPNDSLRLVLPPSASIPLALMFYFLFQSFIPETYLYPFFAAFILGYLIYDMLHYAIHHVNFKGRLWNVLKTHHLKHHYVDPDKGFGVSSPIWDVIVGSDFEKKKLETKQNG